MPIVIPDLSGISQGISGAGSALASALEKRAEKRLSNQQKQEKQSKFDTLLGQFEDYGGEVGALAGVLKQSGVSPDVGLPFLQKGASQMGRDPLAGQSEEELTETLVNIGVPKEQAPHFAKMYTSSSRGGKTEFTKFMFEKLLRGDFGSDSQNLVSDVNDLGSKIGIENITGGDQLQVGEEADIQSQQEQAPPIYPEVNPFQGMLPKEAVKHKQFLAKENNPLIQANNDKMKSLKDENRMIQQMQRLNDSDKLPSGLGRLNVTPKEGKLRLPAGANSETQLYVKMINDWTTKAKESYGSRVTNFDLEQFMARLPTLANSEEGRRLIQSQMEAINDLNQLYYGSIQDVYDNYGASGIDPAEANKIARDVIATRQDEFEQRYVDSLQAQDVYDMKQRLQPGHVLMEKDGLFKQLPAAQQEKAQLQGWRAR